MGKSYFSLINESILVVITISSTEYYMSKLDNIGIKSTN